MKHTIIGTILEVGDFVRGRPTVTIAHDAASPAAPTRIAVDADVARSIARHLGEPVRITIEVGAETRGAAGPTVLLDANAEQLAETITGGRAKVERLLSLYCGVRLAAVVAVGDKDIVFELTAHEGDVYRWTARERGAT